ncbi:MAG TPA: hypothetical protein VJO32_17075, partial [Ktedonobacteraceae bacterium]|nr:hypothetical protein [Ktedonobacteraceae bacterium]
MRRHFIYHRCWLFTGICALLALSFVLSACDQGGSPTKAVKSPVATASTQGIQLGQQPCPDAVKDAHHWNAIVGIDATKTVEEVICGYLMGVPSLQAMVKVGSKDVKFLLDVDVYTAITSAKPIRIFALSRLLGGDVSISNYNTLLTAQVDPNSSLNKGHPAAQQVIDLYREFKWSDSAGTLEPVAFTGLFPDISRYQAEFEQQEVNNGQGYQQWRLSAATTAQNFANFVLKWDPNTPTTVVSGGGAHDARAIALIKNPSAGGATIRLSLSRLELNTNGGIWEVTDVTTDGLSIASPQDMQQLSSPVQVTGVNTAFTAETSTILLLDHDRAAIGQASSSGKAAFAIPIPYSSSFQDGTQEGILTL